MSTAVPNPTPARLGPDHCIAIIAARFNADIVEALTAGCRRRLGELGAAEEQVEVFHVPGAFELPLAARVAAKTKRFAAVICLGCVIRGDTPHFDYVAGEAARGIREAAAEMELPVIFGVLTTNTAEQAWARTGGTHGHAGERAADAAAEMIHVLWAIRQAR